MLVDDILQNNELILNQLKEKSNIERSEYIDSNGEYLYENTWYDYPKKVAKMNIEVNTPLLSGSYTFADIGYKEGDIIKFGNIYNLPQDIAYAKTKQDSFDGKFEYDTQLIYAPYVDLTEYTNISGDYLDNGGFLYGCENLTTIPRYDFSTIINADGAFDKCYKLNTKCFIGVEFPVCISCAYIFDNIEDDVFYCPIFQERVYSRGMFQNIKAKKLILQNELYIQTLGWMFNGCENLEEVVGVIKYRNDVTYESEWDSFTNCYNLRKVWIKGWMQDTINVTGAPQLEWDCIKFLIDNAEVDNYKYLYISSEQSERWTQEPDYQDYLSLASSKNINIIL